MSLGDLRLYECPLSYISAETMDIMRVVFLMEKGAGHFNGAISEDPCWLIEAYEICQGERARMAREKDGSTGH